MLALIGSFVLALSACGGTADMPEMPHISFATLPKPGVLFDRAPPEVVVQRGGPYAELLAGPMLPLLPDDAVETTVAPALRTWLTPLERRQLAEASQRAVLGITGSPVRWASADPDGAETAKGVAMPVDDTQRSVRGRLCRDLWQSVDKAGRPHEQQVTLCRKDFGNGLSVWVVGDANQWP
jgi:surface antigen